MTGLRLLFLAAAIISLGACTQEPERTVEWYQENPDARDAKLQECAAMARLAADADGNCARAELAAHLIGPTEYVSPKSVVKSEG